MRNEPAPIELLKDGAWRLRAEADAAFEREEIDQERWHQRMGAVIEPAYLAGRDPRAQSGYGGDEAAWERARRPILEAIDRGGTLLDVGCANGHLMECLERWAAERVAEVHAGAAGGDERDIGV